MPMLDHLEKMTAPWFLALPRKPWGLLDPRLEQLLPDAVQLYLVIDDLLDHVVRHRADRYLPSVDHQRRRLVDVQVLRQLD